MKTLRIPIGDRRAYLDAYLLEDSAEYDTGRLRPAVLVLPGGAYVMTSDREAEFVALSFAADGYQAFVLRYSVGADAAMPRPVCEGLAAVAQIRTHAEQWHVDAGRVAVCGFSAGGHLASCLMTMWDSPLAQTLGFPAKTLRPDAGILGYPCIVFPARPQEISLGVPWAARKSVLAGYAARLPNGMPPGAALAFREKEGAVWMDGTRLMHLVMMGRADYTDEDLRRYSTDRLVNGRTPPAFVWTTRGDTTVPPGDSLAFAGAMLAAGRPVELHLFGEGPHGLSLARDVTAGSPAMADSAVAQWFPMALEWLRREWKKPEPAGTDGRK